MTTPRPQRKEASVGGKLMYPEDKKSSISHRWAELVSKKPKTAFALTFGLHLFGILLTVILWSADVSILPRDLGPTWTYAVARSEVYERQLQYQVMMADTGLDMWEKTLPVQQTRSIEFRDQNLEIIYEGDCFTQANLASIKLFEDQLYNNSDYQSRICQLDSAGTCKTPKSPLRFFDGSYESFFPNVTDTTGLPIFRPDLNFNRIQEIITDTAFFADGRSSKDSIRDQGDPDIKQILDYHIGRPGLDYDQNDPVTAKFCRSLFYVGYPMPGFRNIKHDVASQRSVMSDLQYDYLHDTLDGTGIVGSMNMFYNSESLRKRAYDDDLELSFLVCAGSGLVAWFGLMHLTKSIAIGTLVSIGIGGTWTWTNIIYRGVLWVEYFGLPQHLAVFVCVFLGIVSALQFFAAWSGLESESELSTRLSVALRKTNKVALATALIGTCVFWLFCFSTVQVVMPFTLFIGMFCLANYFNFFFFLPTAFAMYSGVFGCSHADSKDFYVHLGPKLASFVWHRLIGHKWVRWILLSLCSVAVAVFAIFVANKLDLERMQPKVWTTDAHNYGNFGHFEDIAKVQFGGTDSDTNTKIKIVFGVSRFEKDTCHAGSFQCTRRVVYDDGFDLSSGTAQQQVETFCEHLSSMNISDVNRLKIRRKKTGKFQNGVRPLEVNCWINAQKDYFARQGLDIKLPFNFTDLKTIMQNNNVAYSPTVYRATSFNEPLANSDDEPSCRYCDSYYRHQEFGMLDWISNGGDTLNPTEDLPSFIDSIGGISDKSLVLDNDNMTYAGHYGSVIKYITIDVNLTLNSENADIDDGLDVMNAWNDYIKSEGSLMIRPFQSVFQTCQEDRTWSWLEVQKEAISDLVIFNVIAALIVGLGVLLSTNNAILALLSVMFVVSVTLSVLGIYAILKWKIGIVELLNVSMVVGILSQVSVPFVLAYGVAPMADRDSRTRQALFDQFLSLYGGSLIAFLSTLFLLVSPLWYFWTFAVTLLTTLGLGIVFGLCFFVAICGLIGPENDGGRVIQNFEGLARRFSSVRVMPITSVVAAQPGLEPVKEHAEQPRTNSDHTWKEVRPYVESKKVVTQQMPSLEETPRRSIGAPANQQVTPARSGTGESYSRQSLSRPPLIGGRRPVPIAGPRPSIQSSVPRQTSKTVPPLV